MFEFIATSCCAAFFGAALYISVVQHPAGMEAGTRLAAELFPPMYRRGAALQAPLAAIGAGAACLTSLLGSGGAWFVGGLLLAAVIPFTLVVIKPVNDRLLAPDLDPESPDTAELLARWGSLHWSRTLLSGLALWIFLA